MLQNIWKFLFSSENKKTKKGLKKETGSKAWAEKQIKEMAKLRGKLILM
ncbi:MAG: hypothetical protein Q8P53_02810 [Candidatus Shapirobacteria bacterium]|nr:hypothetical protein [Candidatus Shapirobacteria bacterium]